MAPEAGVATTSIVKASGPANAAPMPTTASRRRAPRPSSGTISTPTAATMPAVSTTPRSHGFHDGVRSSRASAHHAVRPRAAASAPRANQLARRRHSSTAPIPTSAPIAGARATV